MVRRNPLALLNLIDAVPKGLDKFALIKVFERRVDDTIHARLPRASEKRKARASLLRPALLHDSASILPQCLIIYLLPFEAGSINP
jgi:hypothetical protein